MCLCIVFFLIPAVDTVCLPFLSEGRQDTFSRTWEQSKGLVLYLAFALVLYGFFTEFQGSFLDVGKGFYFY
jgi:hypothetical protein